MKNLIKVTTVTCDSCDTINDIKRFRCKKCTDELEGNSTLVLHESQITRRNVFVNNIERDFAL